MAIFSKVVYRKDLPQKNRDELECAYIKDQTPLNIGIPTDSGWSRWKGRNGEGCVFKQGLALEIYVHTANDGKLDEAVIAYRGTENFNFRAAMEDWRTNIAAPFGLEPLQYKLAQQHLDVVIPQLLENTGIQIYATGHSLGGGLAQQAGYYSDSIQEVYAFDPSPVTNWTHLNRNEKIKKPDPVIYRVYHWNETLAYVRNITTRFNNRRFWRQDYEFYFQEAKTNVSGSVEMHEMGILACHLAANIPGNVADHGLTRKAALELLNEKYPEGRATDAAHPICPNGVLLPKTLWEAKENAAGSLVEVGDGSTQKSAVAAP